jgi:hypothetical protein
MVLRSRDRVVTPIHTHVGYNPEELVFRIGDAKGDKKWQGLVQRFTITFSFEHEAPSIHAALQAI